MTDADGGCPLLNRAGLKSLLSARTSTKNKAKCQDINTLSSLHFIMVSAGSSAVFTIYDEGPSQCVIAICGRRYVLFAFTHG